MQKVLALATMTLPSDISSMFSCQHEGRNRLEARAYRVVLSAAALLGVEVVVAHDDDVELFIV